MQTCSENNTLTTQWNVRRKEGDVGELCSLTAVSNADELCPGECNKWRFCQNANPMRTLFKIKPQRKAMKQNVECHVSEKGSSTHPIFSSISTNILSRLFLQFPPRVVLCELGCTATMFKFCFSMTLAYSHYNFPRSITRPLPMQVTYK